MDQLQAALYFAENQRDRLLLQLDALSKKEHAERAEHAGQVERGGSGVSAKDSLCQGPGSSAGPDVESGEGGTAVAASGDGQHGQQDGGGGSSSGASGKEKGEGAPRWCCRTAGRGQWQAEKLRKKVRVAALLLFTVLGWAWGELLPGVSPQAGQRCSCCCLSRPLSLLRYPLLHLLPFIVRRSHPQPSCSWCPQKTHRWRPLRKRWRRPGRRWRPSGGR